MNLNLKIRALQLLVKPVGNLALGLITGAIAAGVAALAKANPDLAAQVDTDAVALFVWGGFMWLMNGWINKQLTAGPKTVQETLNRSALGDKLTVDGIIMPDGATARELERQTGLPVRRAALP